MPGAPTLPGITPSIAVLRISALRIPALNLSALNLPALRLSALRSAAIATLAASLAACSSTGSSSTANGSGIAGMVTYSNPARNSSLSLISESMLIELGVPGETTEERQLAYYSEKRDSASVKICSDEILKGVAEHLNNRGFKKYAVESDAEAQGTQLDGYLSVTLNGETMQMVNSDDSQADPEAKVTFATLLTDFTVIYSEVPQHQAMDGTVEFKKPEISDKLRQATGGSSSSLFPGSIR